MCYQEKENVLVHQVSDPSDVGVLLKGRRLGSRAAGQKINRMITEKLHHLPKGFVLPVDLSAIQRASYLALREIFALLPTLRTAEFAEKYLVFQVDLRNRHWVPLLEVIAREQNGAIPIRSERGEWHVIGKLTKAERETLAIVLEQQAVTSHQLQECWHLLPSAASNRLRRLYDLRLVKREEGRLPRSGGREFIYKPLFYMLPK